MQCGELIHRWGGRFRRPINRRACITRNQMEVNVEDRLTRGLTIELGKGETIATQLLLQERGGALDRGHHACEFFRWKEEELLRVELWDNQGVTTFNRIDIKKGKGVVIFKDFEAGDFTLDNFTKDAVIYVRRPFGVNCEGENGD